VIFHAGWVTFGIRQDFPGGIDDGDASSGRLTFLRGDIGQRLAATINFYAVGQEFSLLDKTAIDFCLQRSLPGPTDHQVENDGRCQDDDHKGYQQLHEDAVSHFVLLSFSVTSVRPVPSVHCNPAPSSRSF
jgi:hypothetical protein